MIDDKKAIDFRDVTYINPSGRTVFEGVNFALRLGQTVVITGEIGSGKTSLMELIIGKRIPAQGFIYVLESKIEAGREKVLKTIRRKIGGAGGIYQPISYQTVFENMRYPLVLRGVRRSEQNRKIIQGLSRFNLLGKKNDPAGNLSRGERILLLLARAVVADQPLLLIDEPLAGLDRNMSRAVNEFLSKLSIAGHSMLILTTGQTDLRMPAAAFYEIRDRQVK